MDTPSQELLTRLEGRAQSGGYGSVDALLEDALKALDLLGEAHDWVEEKLREAYESGPATPMTQHDWDDIRREGLERLKARRTE